MKSPMHSQKTESKTDDDDFQLKMKSTMKIIKRQNVDTIEEEIWKSNETIYKNQIWIQVKKKLIS